MFTTPHQTGWIELICGPMFSGKTEELIRRLRRSQIAKQRVAIFKPQRDARYAENYIVTHTQERLESHTVSDPKDILTLSYDAQVIGVDEAQFFDERVVGVCRMMANGGKRVIVAGLDRDYRAQGFGAMAELMLEAEYVTKVLSICVKCGNPANYSQRLTREKEQIVVGEKDKYEARCRRCYEPPGDG